MQLIVVRAFSHTFPDLVPRRATFILERITETGTRLGMISIAASIDNSMASLTCLGAISWISPWAN